MAFNIMDLFGPAAVNRLLQPIQSAAGVQNFLANPQAAAGFDPARLAGNDRLPAVGMDALRERLAQTNPPAEVASAAPVDPWAGLREADVVKLDPVQTGASTQPQQAAPATARPGSLFPSIDKATLNDMFLGMAMGQTPQQSLALGAAQAASGKRGRNDVNQTVEWLKGRGMDEEQARMVASSPETLQDYLKQMVNPEKQKPLEINGKLVDPSTYQVLADFSDPKDAKDDRTATMKELEAAGLKPGTPEYNEALLANNRPKGMMIESDGQGGFKLVQGADVSGGANLNVEQGKNSGFLLRAQNANKEINDLEKVGTSTLQRTLGSVPLVGNHLVSDDSQKLGQAKRNFINAVLRQESGAVISPEEFANAEQQYFPQPGDGPEVIAQKRQNREDAIAGFRLRSGPGAQAVDQMQSQGGASAPSPSPASTGGVVDYRDYFGGQ